MPPPPPPPPRERDLVPVPSAHDPDPALDQAIRALLDQQLEIQAQLAALLPRKYGPNVRLELEMLQHKRRVLHSYMVEHEPILKPPTLSETEEARQLQYECECLETCLIDHGIDINNAKFRHDLSLCLDSQAPEGFPAWLDKNLAHHDPVAYASRLRDSMPPHFGLDGTTRHYFKCPNERCLHYIYGFPSQNDRDQHAQEHVPPTKRDSGLSLGEGPHLFSDPIQQLPALNFQAPAPKKASPLYLPPPAAAVQLAPLSSEPRGLGPRDQRDSLRPYSTVPDYPAQPSASVETEVDPLLPPLKRSRVGPSRLESIEELRLARDMGLCLRCRALKQACDSHEPCAVCTDRTSPSEDDFWGALGCRRGPLESLADIMLPASLSPRQTHTPMTSPLAQRRNLNEFLESTYVISPETSRTVRSSLDFDDGFWWTEDLASLPPTNPTLASFSREPIERPPPLLAVLAGSWNMGGTAYSFWQLLKMSGLISDSRDAEATTFPILYRAKLLLREILFYDLQQAEPSIDAETSSPVLQPAFDDVDYYGRFRLVYDCLSQFLQSLEDVTARQGTMDGKAWLAVFFSLCIFSIVRTILVDLNNTALRQSQGFQHSSSSVTPSGSAAMHGFYKALVSIYTGSSPAILDDVAMGRIEMAEEDQELFNTVNLIIKRGTWAERGMHATHDFLVCLGSGGPEGELYHGFVRQRSPGRTRVFSLPPMLQTGEDQRKQLPHIRSFGEAWPSSASMFSDRDTRESREPYTFRGSASGGPLSSPQETDPGHSRRQTVGPSSPTFSRASSSGGGRGLTSPIPASRARSSHHRPPLRRVYCTKCNEYPEGFRGEHELRRHTDAKHAALVKRWVCTEPQHNNPMASPQPVVPLSKCKACVTQKRYGAYYNAAAHLRRTHFNPHRGGKASGDWPTMAILKYWMREVRQSVDAQDPNDSSDGEDEGEPNMADFGSPNSRRSPMIEIPRLAPAPPVPGPITPLSLAPAPPLHPPPPPPPHMGVASSGMHVGSMHHRVPPPMLMTPTLDIPPPNAAGMMFQTNSPGPSPVSMFSGHHHHIPGTKPPSLDDASQQQAAANRNRCPHPECRRVFKDLAAHMLTHMEERPEKCPIESCEYHTKGFARKYDKNRHALTHYKGTMVCPFCPGAGTAYEKAFNRADVFKRHLTAVHNVEQTPPNSRKMVIGAAARAAAVAAGGDGFGGGAGARCSICQSSFITAQEFYEHLDDCVLNVIVPATPKSVGPLSATTMASASMSNGGAATGGDPRRKDSIVSSEPSSASTGMFTMGLGISGNSDFGGPGESVNGREPVDEGGPAAESQMMGGDEALEAKRGGSTPADENGEKMEVDS